MIGTAAGATTAALLARTSVQKARRKLFVGRRLAFKADRDTRRDTEQSRDVDGDGDGDGKSRKTRTRSPESSPLLARRLLSLLLLLLFLLSLPLCLCLSVGVSQDERHLAHSWPAKLSPPSPALLQHFCMRNSLSLLLLLLLAAAAAPFGPCKQLLLNAPSLNDLEHYCWTFVMAMAERRRRRRRGRPAGCCFPLDLPTVPAAKRPLCLSFDHSHLSCSLTLEFLLPLLLVLEQQSVLHQCKVMC